MNKINTGYLAGIIDGEGCIYVNKRKATGRRKTPGYGVKVVVSITSYSLVEWFIKNAKLTSIFERKVSGNRKRQWMCTWNNSAAEWLLNIIVKHLVIKKEQATLGLELLKHLRILPQRRGVCISKENIEYRDTIKQKISALNRRGKPLSENNTSLEKNLCAVISHAADMNLAVAPIMMMPVDS